MEIRQSSIIASLRTYPFADIDAVVARLRQRGIEPIDFGVGDPTDPTPVMVREALKEGADRFASSGYPPYEGTLSFRKAAADWFYRRFGVPLDPETEVCATIGAKEAVFHLPFALIEPGDIVLCPSPGYPPYGRGTLFARGVPYYYPLRKENGFLPDLEGIPEDVLRRARIIWINYPNSPTGRVPPDAFYESLIEFARKWSLVVASDEAYSEVWFERRPRSVLEFSKEGVIVFQSLSKRSAMTGYRVGFVCGDARLIGLFRTVKTNVDSGTPWFIQAAAEAALSDEGHVEEMRARYKVKRDILVEALREVGCEIEPPEATMYLWPKVPKGMSGLDFAKRLLEPDIGVVCTPGVFLCEPLRDGSNPGEAYCRFALVPGLKAVEEAAQRIRRALR